jgi:hypothetical protein
MFYVYLAGADGWGGGSGAIAGARLPAGLRRTSIFRLHRSLLVAGACDVHSILRPSVGVYGSHWQPAHRPCDGSSRPSVDASGLDGASESTSPPSTGRQRPNRCSRALVSSAYSNGCQFGSIPASLTTYILTEATVGWESSRDERSFEERSGSRNASDRAGHGAGPPVVGGSELSARSRRRQVKRKAKAERVFAMLRKSEGER